MTSCVHVTLATCLGRGRMCCCCGNCEGDTPPPGSSTLTVSVLYCRTWRKMEMEELYRNRLSIRNAAQTHVLKLLRGDTWLSRNLNHAEMCDKGRMIEKWEKGLPDSYQAMSLIEQPQASVSNFLIKNLLRYKLFKSSADNHPEQTHSMPF